MIAWMSYAVLVGVIVACGAAAADRVARLRGISVRWAWVGAMGLAVALAAAAPYRVDAPRAVSTAVAPAGGPAVIPAGASPWALRMLRDVAATATQLFQTPLAGAAARIDRRVGPRVRALIGAAWLAASMALAGVFVAVHLRFRRARRGWPVADVHGVRVRVSPRTGPVVVGVARPEIVVPRWLLARSAPDQRVVIAHESEHVRARDTGLLAAACTIAVLMPWNAALWFMLSRLRLAVELDCDARVLRGGVAPRAYGDLLIDVAEQSLPLRLTAAALADDASHLHQRILAMKPEAPRFALARAGAAAAFALVSLLAACEAKLPTAADVNAMDAASAERAARKLALVNPDSSITYTIDGVPATAAAAKALLTSSIDAVEINKSPTGKSTIALTTFHNRKTGTTDTVLLNASVRDVGVARGRAPGDGGDLKMLTTKLATSRPIEGRTPIFFIDGVRAEQSAVPALDRNRIESVEVLKGRAAIQQYGADAANGVIIIKTKPAGAEK